MYVNGADLIQDSCLSDISNNYSEADILILVSIIVKKVQENEKEKRCQN